MRLHRRTTKSLLQIVRDNPGITESDLAARLGISRPAVHKRILRAKAAGVLREHKVGYSASVEIA